MQIMRERQDHRTAARAVQAAAFDEGQGEPAEARLVDALRQSDAWIPAVSWVAEIDEDVVGHSVCTRGHVGDVPCLGLGPIAVAPNSQRSGIGSALMHATIGAADALGEPLIALLGDPAYYSRFGFIPSLEVGIAPSDEAWGPYFQVRRLSSWSASIAGTFRYAAPFDDLS